MFVFLISFLFPRTWQNQIKIFIHRGTRIVAATFVKMETNSYPERDSLRLTWHFCFSPAVGLEVAKSMNLKPGGSESHPVKPTCNCIPTSLSEVVRLRSCTLYVCNQQDTVRFSLSRSSPNSGWEYLYCV